MYIDMIFASYFRAKILAGDKLAVRDGKIFCLSLIKVEELVGMVKSVFEEDFTMIRS